MPATIIERALELVPNDSVIGLGSGRAAQAFVRGLAERVRSGQVNVRGVATSDETAQLASELGIPLMALSEAGNIHVTFDGADEVDSKLDLIKGYGRALVREKIVAASSERVIILVGEEKLVPRLGTRGKLPVEIVPFALPLCARCIQELNGSPMLWSDGNGPLKTDNGNYILDCQVQPIDNPRELQSRLREIPGVVDTGLFLGIAETVLVGDRNSFRIVEERRRTA